VAKGSHESFRRLANGLVIINDRYRRNLAQIGLSQVGPYLERRGGEHHYT
jgi:hypothetical protein